jgi:hypothetical protein
MGFNNIAWASLSQVIHDEALGSHFYTKFNCATAYHELFDCVRLFNYLYRVLILPNARSPAGHIHVAHRFQSGRERHADLPASKGGRIWRQWGRRRGFIGAEDQNWAMK